MAESLLIFSVNLDSPTNMTVIPSAPEKTTPSNMAIPPTTTTLLTPPDTYVINFPDCKFIVTSTMLRFDAPNMFSNVFLSNSTFYESQSRAITIPDKDPHLFKMIYDYLRGYKTFPLNEAAVEPRWLPLHKTYDNLRRDASYYGFARFEAECSNWLKSQINPNDKQAVLRLGFMPFPSYGLTGASHPLTAEMVLDCHVSNIPLLRKRFLKCGTKNLTYGPMPWKYIFEQIKEPLEGSRVLKPDGSAVIEAPSVFLKPPRALNENIDPRKMELAKIQLSKRVTQLILDGVRPAGMSSYITLRFHITDITTSVCFEKNSGQFIFQDKLQSDGYTMLSSLVPKITSLLEFPCCKTDKTVVRIDNTQLVWRGLYDVSDYVKRSQQVPQPDGTQSKAVVSEYFKMMDDGEPMVPPVLERW